MSENTFEITLSTGRKWVVKPLPKHFFLYYGELPSSMLNKAVEAVESGNEEVYKEVEASLSPEQKIKSLIFTREAVNHFCVNPKISLTPQNENEISPFEISEEEFAELAVLAMRGAGGEANGLKTFRGKSDETSPHRAHGAKLRKKTK